ncbi:Ig-like domain-containing protein, partial [Enterobacter cloacae]|uniref:Ig-like domain-containing protein n=1 Tax=Enterobacter cloacae TaxID=550 RepID=UPI003EE28EC9
LDASGNWSVGVPAGDVTVLGSGSQTITATLTDRAGNSDSATRDISVSLDAPIVSVGIVAVDDFINSTEKTQDLTIRGNSTGLAAGTRVTVTLNSLNYTGTTDASGNWSVTVPAADVGQLGEAVYQITATATNSAGNSGSTTHTVEVESELPGVIVNPVATDDIINAAEAGADQTVSGRVTGAASGDTVTVSLGGKTYTTTVQADLSWSISVPSADLQALGDGAL